jgi:hypothetical protein
MRACVFVVECLCVYKFAYMMCIFLLVSLSFSFLLALFLPIHTPLSSDVISVYCLLCLQCPRLPPIPLYGARIKAKDRIKSQQVQVNYVLYCYVFVCLFVCLLCRELCCLLFVMQLAMSIL